ncbi:MAG TPA: isochorismate synthase [Acidimicrobiales bacterium]|nr:isochorismate synthase [Acidimicrobiales bacterium]
MTLTSGTSHKAAEKTTTLRRAAQLRSFTTRLPAEALPDLVRAGGAPDRWLWKTTDLALLGVGEALRIPLGGDAGPDDSADGAGWTASSNATFVANVLQSLQVGDDPAPATGPVAMGALPYDPGRPGHLSIPSLLLASDNASIWATRLFDASSTMPGDQAGRAIEAEVRDLANGADVGELPDRFELLASMPHGEWKRLVKRAVRDMERGGLDKVVVARKVDISANRPFVVAEVLARLSYLYPSCTIFHVEGFLGASPETLLRKLGDEVVSTPLAGTVARSGDDATDKALLAGLMASAKDRREHGLVVDAIAAELAPLCRKLDVPAEPSVLALRNVSHLATHISGQLRPQSVGQGPGSAVGGDGLPSALQLAALLHPTPAVGGHPTEAALDWQRSYEGFDRGRYAGPVGWVDRHGNGDWALGLRSATIRGATAALYAGNGIVPGSDPDAELGETQLKLQALLAAMVRP